MGVNICRTTGSPNSDGTCPDNQVLINNKCYVARNVGMFCTKDIQCSTGNCVDNVCRPQNVLTDASGTCDPRAGPYCPTGYYCEGAACVPITSGSTSCDLGGSNACPMPTVCDPLALKCYTPNDVFQDTTAGYAYSAGLSVSVGGQSAPLKYSGPINAASDAEALAECASDWMCAGVTSNSGGRFLVLNETASYATTGSIYTSLFF